jgi:hypothetical protein
MDAVRLAKFFIVLANPMIATYPDRCFRAAIARGPVF